MSVQIAGTVKYQSSDASVLRNVTLQVNASGSVEALFGCTLTSEALQIARLIDTFRKPLKSILFTNGPPTPVSPACALLLQIGP